MLFFFQVSILLRKASLFLICHLTSSWSPRRPCLLDNDVLLGHNSDLHPRQPRSLWTSHPNPLSSSPIPSPLHMRPRHPDSPGSLASLRPGTHLCPGSHYSDHMSRLPGPLLHFIRASSSRSFCFLFQHFLLIFMSVHLVWTNNSSLNPSHMSSHLTP